MLHVSLLSLLCLSGETGTLTFTLTHLPSSLSLSLAVSLSLPLPSTGLGTLTVLEEYGKLSGESNTHCWQDEGWCLEQMPLPAIGQEDMEQDSLSVKLDWIMELVYN